jgi:hypothetical protein
MLSENCNSSLCFATKERGRKVWAAGFWTLSGISVASALYLILRRRFYRAIANESSLPDGMKPERQKTPSARPYLEIDKIVSFGRSVELKGRVEAGSKLSVNNENIEVSGDGSFKHFTKRFPASSSRICLEIQATDLAGRTRILTAFHDFSSSGESN